MSTITDAKTPRTFKTSKDGVARRQTYATGTVQQIRASLPTPVTYTTPHGPTLEDANPDPTISPLHSLPQFTDADVENAITFITTTQINPWLDSLITDSRKKSGRPSRTPPTAILVAMWLCAQEGRGMLITQFRDVLYHRISPTMRQRLNVTATPTPLTRRDVIFWNRAAEASVRRAFRRLLLPIDPSPYTGVKSTRKEDGQKTTWTEVHEEVNYLSDEEAATLQGRLDWLCNQMLDAAFKQLPRQVRRQYNGSACIDGTPLRSFWRGVSGSKGCQDVSSDPDAGFYTREGNHADARLAEDGTPVRDAKYQRRKSTAFWAYDLTLMVAADDQPGPRQYMPALPIALTSAAPAVGPSDCARRAIASFIQRQYNPKYLAGDNLYTNAIAEKFQIPAREAGFSLVLPYSRSTIGHKGSAAGMHMIEGAYHCPSTPDDLVEATKDFLNKKIDLKVYHIRIKERNLYRMRTKQLPVDGIGERLTCPAAGASPVAICALKPSSEEPRPTRQANGTIADARPVIKPLRRFTENGRVKVCRQDSVAVKPTDGAKYRQELIYGSEEHSTIYNLLRQSQEGLHGFAKDENHEGLGNPGKRRARGIAAQTMFAAFMLAAASIRKIRGFLNNAITDPVTGEIYVERKTRTGKHATTDHPAGVVEKPEPAIFNDEDDDPPPKE